MVHHYTIVRAKRTIKSVISWGADNFSCCQGHTMAVSLTLILAYHWVDCFFVLSNLNSYKWNTYFCFRHYGKQQTFSHCIDLWRAIIPHWLFICHKKGLIEPRIEHQNLVNFAPPFSVETLLDVGHEIVSSLEIPSKGLKSLSLTEFEIIQLIYMEVIFAFLALCPVSIMHHIVSWFCCTTV